MTKCPLLVLTALLSAFPLTASAEEAAHHWPAWRGPMATGVSPHGDPPVRFSETQNVAFKVEVPGLGLATPVVWEDKVFLLTAVPADEAAYAASQKAAADKLAREEWPPSVDPVKQRFVVMALSRKDGKVLWQHTAAERAPHESHHIDASWASASPVTDGKRLFASFGSNGLYAYDMDGKLLWQKDLGDMRTRAGFGEGSSPALHGDVLVVNWDHEEESFLVGLDAATGKELWRVARPDEATSWSTPLVVTEVGKPQVVVSATGHSRGYELASGKEIWRLSGMTLNTIPSPVYGDGVVYLTSGFRGNNLQAVDLRRAQGDLAGADSKAGDSKEGDAKEGDSKKEPAAVLWTYDRDTPYVPSMLLYGDKLYFHKHNRGILSCLDAKTGKVHYTERLPGVDNVYASPVGAAGRVYVTSREGKVLVLKNSATLEVLAENSLDDRFDASPAIVGGDLFLRGRKHLYRIAEAPAASPQEESTPEEKAGR